MKQNVNNINRILGGCLCLFLGLWLAGCADESLEEPQDNHPVEPESARYKVAVVMPLSHESMRIKCERIVAWAQENMLDAIDSNGPSVQLDIEWYDEDREDMGELAMKLAYREDLMAIIGPYASQHVEVLAQECAVSHKTIIVPVASSAELVRRHAGEGYFWSLVETDISQCETLLSIALEKGCRRVSLIASDDIYGQTFIDWFAFQADELGMTVDQVLSYQVSDLPEVMQQALSTHPEALVCVPGRVQDVRTMLEVKGRNHPTQLLFSDNAFQISVLEDCGSLAEEMEGVGDCADPETGFQVAYRVRFGEEPLWESYLYDAVFMTLMGVYDLEVNGGTDLNESLKKITVLQANDSNLQGAWMPGILWSYLYNIMYQNYFCLNGATGKLAFDANVFTNVLHSTYCHWVAYRQNFLVMDYHTTDGTHRTHANLANWNWKKEHEQHFDQSRPDPVYPALQQRWALVVAASQGWKNYRHQADALAFYQLLKRQGYDDKHIVLIAEDDIAGHGSNFAPGKVFVSPQGEDVYAGAVIDYKLSDLRPDDLKLILAGQRSERLSQVIEAGEQDNVLVFWSGHGSPGALAWGDTQSFSQADASELLSELHRGKKYRRMLWLVETCYAGSVAKVCQDVPGVMWVTASGEWETSKPDVPYRDVWLSNRFTQALLQELQAQPDITLRELYYKLFRATTGSHVCVYNEKGYGSVYRNGLGEFL